MAFDRISNTPNQLNIYNADGYRIKSLPADDTFFEDITIAELMQGHEEWNHKMWYFAEFSPYGVRVLYHSLPPQDVTRRLTQIYQEGLGLMELCRGDFSHPTWIPLTSTLNKGEVKQKWYKEYCKAHGYVILSKN